MPTSFRITEKGGGLSLKGIAFMTVFAVLTVLAVLEISGEHLAVPLAANPTKYRTKRQP